MEAGGSTYGAWVRLGAPGGSGWRRFRSPVRIIETYELDEVGRCLDLIQAASASGLYAVGMVSYEAAAAFDPAFPLREPNGFPLVSFGVYEDFDDVAPSPGPSRVLVGPWARSTSEAEYRHALGRIREAIADGTTYQVNHTVRLHARLEGDEEAYFVGLTAAQPSPYSALLNLGRYRVLSVSPELFFRRVGDVISTRPMKGTAPRGCDPAHDLQQREWLLRSEKNRAENVMIVDLLRNDLGRVARPGAVQVTSLCEVETWPTLHTLTSSVEARLRPGVGLRELFAALFPCGSVTGAPKASTMALIAELEAEPRLVYCGAIGVVEPGGDLEFNVPIRTVVIDTATGIAEYGVGGGITWDSDPDEELEETRTKSRLLGEAAPPCAFIETFRAVATDDATEFRHLERHLRRLAASARHWRLPYSPDEVRAALVSRVAAAGIGLWRCRIELRADGHADVTVSPLGGERPTLAVLSATSVDSTDPRLRYKTSQREVYEAAVASLPAGTEALLTNERGEITEFTTGNVVVELDGQRVTPPLKCGLLPGVGRAVALERGEITEQVITVADLPRITSIWHVNSLRGWQKMELTWPAPAGPEDLG